MTILDLLYEAEGAIASAIQEAKRGPRQLASDALIAACERVDTYYKEFCEEFGPETYDEGININIEFYIEAEAWHDISLALRALRATGDTK